MCKFGVSLHQTCKGGGCEFGASLVQVWCDCGASFSDCAYVYKVFDENWCASLVWVLVRALCLAGASFRASTVPV